MCNPADNENMKNEAVNSENMNGVLRTEASTSQTSRMQDENNSMQCNRKYICLLLSALALGILFDILFNDKSFGVSYPIFVIAFYVLFKWNLREKLEFRFDFGWALSLPILMLSLTYFLFSNEIFIVLNFLAIPVLVVLQTTIVTGCGRYKWHTPGVLYDLIIGFIYRPLAFAGKPFVLVSRLLRSRIKNERYNTLAKVLIGVLASLPLLLVIIPLLSSADIIFENFLGEIPALFRDIAFQEFISHIILSVVIATMVFSYMWSMLYQKTMEGGNAGSGISTGLGTGILGEASVTGRDSSMPEVSFAKKWDPIITTTVFSIINAIYLFFAFIQFSYLFGSLSYGLPEGFTYAEYARRGFFELVVVTIINFSLLLLFLYGTGKGSKVSNRVIQVLYSLLVFNTGVMLFSAYFRMSLYEEAYGYTYLRLLTHTFMVFLLVLFAITLYRIWKENVCLLRPYIITTVAAFVIINYMNIDVIIARNNINRYHNTGKIDIGYLAELSWDAVPGMVELLDAGDDKVSKIAEDYLYKKKEELSKPEPWQSFNLSKYRAKRLLSKYQLNTTGSLCQRSTEVEQGASVKYQLK